MKRFLFSLFFLFWHIIHLQGDPSVGVDFAREVLPVLSNKCFACHGPDTKKKDLVRLDSEEAAKRDLGGFHAVDEKSPEDSELIFRIFDQDEPMPPKDFDKSLTKKEKEILKKWVLAGGGYAKHWAFVKPAREKVKGNPVDHYIGAALKHEGKSFAPEAKREVLARRVSLTLTGLPPGPDRLKAFLEDGKEDAYERFVDLLLTDSNYGEHQARYWLDAVRYGDTHGLHLDNKRGIYPYRDWVVRALNDNLPFDEFITWQLAGDLLPEPTLDQKIPTGFVRMNPSTAEGGAIPDEFQAKNNFDRWKAWALPCSECPCFARGVILTSTTRSPTPSIFNFWPSSIARQNRPWTGIAMNTEIISRFLLIKRRGLSGVSFWKKRRSFWPVFGQQVNIPRVMKAWKSWLPL